MAVKYFPGHYITCGVMNNSVTSTNVLIDNAKLNAILTKRDNIYLYKNHITGCHTQAWWRDMEQGTTLANSTYQRGIDAFGAALTRLAPYDLKLSLEIQCRTFGATVSGGVVNPNDYPQPVYMRSNPLYGNPPQGTPGSHYVGTSHVTTTHIMPRMWNATVVDRFIAMLNAYGEAFNGDDRFAGIHLEEWHGIDSDSDPRETGRVRENDWMEGQIKIYDTLATAFSNSMAFQTANWIPRVNQTNGAPLSDPNVLTILRHMFDKGIGLSVPDYVQAKVGSDKCMNTVIETTRTLPVWQAAARVRTGDRAGYYHPVAVQAQRPSTRVSTAAFGVSSYLKAVDVGANAVANNKQPSPEGHTWYACDKAKAGIIIWSYQPNGVDDHTTCRPVHWDGPMVLAMINRMATNPNKRVNNQPPYVTDIPITVQRRGPGQPGQYEAPSNLRIVNDELVWEHNGTLLKEFIVAAGDSKARIGKSGRSIPISALKIGGGGVTVSVVAVKNDGTKSSNTSIEIDSESLDPPSKVCVTSSTVSWEEEEDGDGDTTPTGFTIYLIGGVYTSATLVAATGPFKKTATLPSTLVNGTSYTVTVKTVTQSGLSDGLSLTFTHPVSAQTCTSDAPAPSDCSGNDPLTKLASCAVPKVSGTPHTIVPGFRNTHDTMVAALNAKKYDLVFLGDSITASWSRPAPRGLSVWNTTVNGFSLANGLGGGGYNAGIGADRVQHVLWRVKGGKSANATHTAWALDNARRYFATKKHKVAVLNIGTNNTGAGVFDSTVSEAAGAAIVANGIIAIVNEIKAQSSDTKILVIGVLPKAIARGDSRGKLINAALLAEYGSTLVNNVRYVDLRTTFANSTSDGDIKESLFLDGLHPNNSGYVAYAGAIRTILRGLLT